MTTCGAGRSGAYRAVMVIALSGTPKALPEQTDDYKKLWIEYQPCTLTTLRPVGGPHMAPVGVTIDPATGIV
ncbi:hypothetical protein GCM10010282_29230 [Streptomyces roseolus]|nr:hypothetical protein GCM10010282_29230 [Streptomyces roseolus]